LIPATPARFVHEAFWPWQRPSLEALRGRTAIWHTLWSEAYSNPRYAELVPRLQLLFFAPIRQRTGLRGRVDGAVARRTRFIQRQTLAWYHRSGLRVLLTPDPTQARLFDGPVVVDLDDPTGTPEEEAALRTPNVQHVIVTTNSTARRVRASRPELDITVVPQGVDLQRATHSQCARVRDALFCRCSMPPNTIIVGYHAPIICVSADPDFQGKTFHTFYADILISSILKLWKEGLSFIVVLVGNTSQSIKKLALSEPRLVLSGYVDRDQLFDWVGAFDIGTYPRTVDFHGRESVKLLEYMASSAAIVAMKTSETAFLQETATGYVATEPDEFSQRLRSLILNHHERATLRRRGRGLVESHDWRSLAVQYDQVLAAVAATA
jgi:glycosyltransferase involved in cell wall biosynthesis